jgi:hypothetical protein
MSTFSIPIDFCDSLKYYVLLMSKKKKKMPIKSRGFSITAIASNGKHDPVRVSVRTWYATVRWIAVEIPRGTVRGPERSGWRSITLRRNRFSRTAWSEGIAADPAAICATRKPLHPRG